MDIKILHINTNDLFGGAAHVAWNLFCTQPNSYFAVGTKHSNHNRVFELPKHIPQNSWQTFWFGLEQKTAPLIGKIKGAGKLKNFFHNIAWPKNFIDQMRGAENFNFSGTKKLLELCPEKPDIIHMHNLHGNYFDIRELANISQKIPTIVTLHDAWMLGGHCAHSFECQKWKTGCKSCPNLSTYVSLKRDSSAYNFLQKKKTYKNSNLYISTPCQWLMNKVKKSILTNGMIEGKIIPNGVDLTVFKPANKNMVRKKLGINDNEFVLLFVGHSIKNNPWKDYITLRKAIEELSRLNIRQKITLICLGEQAPKETLNNITITFVPYQKTRQNTVQYFQAADVYVHPANAETFPNVILEALACGLPVIASNVGGISEQIDEKTGILVKPQDPYELKNAILEILNNKSRRESMRTCAIKKAQENFSLEKQAKSFVSWYDEILAQNKK